MKIAIVCGTLEPEMNGVGDYARRLGAELIRQGHTVFLISFYDHFIKSWQEEKQKQEGIIIPVLRLGAANKEKSRFRKASELLNHFKPDWISLQYVPYSYNYRGFPWTFSNRLKNLGGDWKWHIMFHELWVEAKYNDSVKRQVTGFLQKQIIKRMLQHLSPVISTTLPAYRNRLGKERCSILPLFGNIPIENGVLVIQDKNRISAVHFGGFSAKCEEFEAQLNWLKDHAEFHHKKLRLLLLGGGGNFKKVAISIANKILGENSVIDLGRLRGFEVSKIFQNADVGISRADVENFQKSGSTISMLEHGLPVLLRGQRNVAENTGIINFKNLLYCNDDIKKEYKRLAPFSILEITSQKFLKDLRVDSGDLDLQNKNNVIAFQSIKQ